MLGGVEISESKAQKDELILEGNDIDNVSQSGTLAYRFCETVPLTSYQLPPSRVFAAFATKISGSFWMASTYQTGALSSPRINFVFLVQGLNVFFSCRATV